MSHEEMTLRKETYESSAIGQVWMMFSGLKAFGPLSQPFGKTNIIFIQLSFSFECRPVGIDYND